MKRQPKSSNLHRSDADDLRAQENGAAQSRRRERNGDGEIDSTSRVSVSLSPQDYIALRALAATGQRSLGWIMRHALRKLLEAQTTQLELPFHILSNAETRVPRSEDAEHSRRRLLEVNWKRIRRRTSGTVHNLHPYPTRFRPEIPSKLIEVLSQPGETVLDPFCGSGTTIIEAMRLGRRSVGVDLSPLGILISRVKSTRLSDRDRCAIRATLGYASVLVSGFWDGTRYHAVTAGSLEDLIVNYRSRSAIETGAPCFSPAVVGELSRWFPMEVLAEVLLIRTVVDQCPLSPAKNLLMVALSAILLALSYRRSETRRARIARDVKPSQPLALWGSKVFDLQNLVIREHESLPWPPADLYEGDARNLNFLAPCSVDLAITSPPYPNTFDYRSFQRLRLLALGLERSGTVPSDVGSPRKYWNQAPSESEVMYTNEMRAILKSLSRVLKPTGRCAFIVGPSRVRGKVQDNVSLLHAGAVKEGFCAIASLDLGSSSTTGSTQRAAFLRAGESIVVLQAGTALERNYSHLERL